jgi:hypothetical protein
LEVGNNSVLASVTKGFFADVDLQAGTIGTCTAVGTGTATSSSITAVGGGYLCNITGKVDASAATPTVFIAICSAAGTTSFAGANNQALLYEGVQLVTASSIGNTTFNVDTDTGWKSGDLICVASTNRTAADCEDYVLNADAGASSMTSALHPLGYGGPTTSVTGTVHNGTSPVQAEVGLLTRNVKIRSTSSSLMSYVYAAALATATISWAEFYYLGQRLKHYVSQRHVLEQRVLEQLCIVCHNDIWDSHEQRLGDEFQPSHANHAARFQSGRYRRDVN